MRILILLSGGIDSLCCLALYRQAGHDVTAAFIDYGQPVNKREEESARAVARHYVAPLDVIRCSEPIQKLEGEIAGRNAFKSAVGDWQRSLRRLFVLAGVPSAHAHRFRDTFSVELLQAGVPLERVSILLGHQSVRVTEKHYNAWTLARQEQAESDVRRIWGETHAGSKGTPKVREKISLVN